jgi:diguanylate cyclase (GGDEF)-like protein
MHLLNWVDYRTLAASELPLALVFAVVLFGIWRVYPHLRGTDTMASSFSLWMPAAALLAAQGSLPLFASSILGNLLLICGYILLYRGLLSFLQVKGNLPVLYDVAAVASAVIIYFTTIYELPVPRIVAICVVVAVARGLMAIELFRNAKERLPLQLFASFLALFAVLPLGVAAAALSSAASSQGGPSGLAGLQSLGVLCDVAFLLGCGIFAFRMYFDEISETVQQQGQLDFLTGTLNRRAIEEVLTVEIARSSRTHRPVSVLMVEIDHFKAINETYGRNLGDATLCTVVATIGSILRFYDKCGRIAEDKFLVVLPENTGEHSMVIASRFRAALKEPSLPHDQPAITLSIGVTQCTFKEPAAEVLARAELALREVRANGRDGACLKFEHEQPLQAPPPANLDRLRTSSRIAKLIR